MYILHVPILWWYGRWSLNARFSVSFTCRRARPPCSIWVSSLRFPRSLSGGWKCRRIAASAATSPQGWLLSDPCARLPGRPKPPPQASRTSPAPHRPLNRIIHQAVYKDCRDPDSPARTHGPRHGPYRNRHHDAKERQPAFRRPLGPVVVRLIDEQAGVELSVSGVNRGPGSQAEAEIGQSFTIASEASVNSRRPAYGSLASNFSARMFGPAAAASITSIARKTKPSSRRRRKGIRPRHITRAGTTAISAVVRKKPIREAAAITDVYSTATTSA